MKEYLVDVPVSIQAFVRPDMLRKQWEVIKEARPSILFIRSDGPRPHVPTDRALIEESRRITEDIDWSCEVHRLYSEENLGMYGNSKKNVPYIFEHVDRCIFLEDDQIPSVSFFAFCAELLEKYKDDTRISRITGVNLCGKWENTSADYFFARVPVSSGAALWRRSYMQRDCELLYAKDPHVMKNLKKSLPWYLKKQFKSFAKTGTYANHGPGGEFFVRSEEYCQNQLVIVPRVNLITNIGVGAGSTHTAAKLRQMPRALQKVYTLEHYELELPLKHPRFVMSDRYFEKEREKQLGVRTRFQAMCRALERSLRLLLFGGTRRIFQKLKRVVKHDIES